MDLPALHDNETLRAALDATPFPVALVDLQDDRIFFWSNSALALFGHTAPTASQWYQIAYPDPDYRREVVGRWKPALEIARHQSPRAVNAGEYLVTCLDGSVRICELYAAFIADYLVVTFNDITEKKNAEAALRRDQEELQSLAGRLITVQEEERKRIARDLHDDLSQRLALLCVDLDLLRQRVPDGAEVARELGRIRRETDQLVLDMRRLSHNEHHPQLALGLQHGVASFCQDFSRQHGIAVKLVHEGDARQIPEAVCFALFRVLQEAMSNVAKHSGTDRVTVTISVDGDQALLRVADQGRGFEVGSDVGLGLISMRERLRLVGGTMRVNSSLLKGTDLEALVPIPIPRGAVSASA